MILQSFFLFIIKYFVKDFEGFDKFILVAEPVEFHSAGSSAPSISASSFYSDSLDDGTSISSFSSNTSYQGSLAESNSSEFYEQLYSDSDFIIGRSATTDDIYAAKTIISTMAGKSRATGGDDHHSVLPERGVPQFDGTLSRWKEYEKKGDNVHSEAYLGEEGGRSGSHAIGRADRRGLG